MAAKKSVQALAKKKAPARRKATRRKAPTKRARERRSTAQVLERSMEIVLARDEEMMTWAEISLKFKIDEGSARRAYQTYNAEIAPLVSADRPPDVVLSYLRMYERQRRNLVNVVAKEPLEHVAVARGIIAVLDKEISLRQRVGLLPPDLGDLPKIQAFEFMLDHFVRVLRRLNAPPEIYAELEAAMRGDLPVIEHAALPAGD